MDEYLRPAFEELFNEDGLAVFGKGLGAWELFMKFVLLYSKPFPGQQQRKLVFCLQAVDKIEEIRKCLLYEGVNPINFPKVSFDNFIGDAVMKNECCR